MTVTMVTSTMTKASVRGMRRMIRKDCQAKVPITTMNMTPVSAASGICSIRSISRINTLFALPLIYPPPNSTGAEPSSTLANCHELAFQPAKTDHITGPNGLIPPLQTRQAKPNPCHTTRHSLTDYELLEWFSQTDRVAAAHGSVAR
tara:strand:+ start:5186 stop:5626 length:441 start_codon:yes stop_codon:yes gene_type:complete